MRWLLTALLLLLPLPAGADALTDAIEDGLRARGLDGRLLVTVTSGAEAGIDAEAAVTINTLDPANGRFTATATETGDGGLRQVRLVGRVDRIVEVPVPNRSIAPGEVIREHDLDWIEMAGGRLGNHTVTMFGAIVGHAARRALRPGQPVSVREIELPVVVRKGTLVTMILDRPGLLLTATGRALEDGADGAAIALMNVQSKRTVQGTVVGPDQVRIDDGGLVALR